MRTYPPLMRASSPPPACERSRVIAYALLSLGLILAAVPALAQDQLPFANPSVIHGTGTQFTFEDDAFTMTVETTDTVQVMIGTTSPDHLLMTLDGQGEASSTDVTVSGFVPDTTLYMYIDGVGPESFDTGPNGTYTFTQDLTAPRFVMIRPTTSTIHLTTPGLHTLSTDVNEEIWIEADDVTLDGQGHTISNSSFVGIHVANTSRVTIKNLSIQGSTYGVLAFSLPNSPQANLTIENVIFEDNSTAVLAAHYSSVTARNSTVRSGSTPTARGIEIVGAFLPVDNVVVTGNEISATQGGIRLENVHTAFVTDNLIRDEGFAPPWLSANAVSLHQVKTANIEGNDCETDVAPLSIGGYCTDVVVRWNVFTATGPAVPPFEPWSLVIVGPDLTAEIYSNDFISADPLADPAMVCGGEFNKDCPVGGNFWSTYEERSDADGDGIADTPYELDCASTGRVQTDFLPLMQAGFPTKTWGCAPATITVSGNVTSDCMGPLQWVRVGVTAGDDWITGETDASGNFTLDVPSTDAGEFYIVKPLGYDIATVELNGSPVTEPTEVIPLTLSADQVVDFTLICQDAETEARSKGYWKHNANVYLWGRGHAQEEEADMCTNYPMAVFEHFHDAILEHAIQIEGVTYRSGADCPCNPDPVCPPEPPCGDPTAGQCPIDLETIANTLSSSGGMMMVEKAKMQYLALLLNVASGKLQTYSPVSEDDPPANASQALQQIADMILDGDSSNDELAKDIADAMNNGSLVGAGIIDLTLPYVPYEEDAGFVRVIPNEFALSQNRPNPVSPTTTIRLSMPEAAGYVLSIHDVQGRVVRRFEGSAQPGVVPIFWDGRDQTGAPVAAGVYFYRVSADDFSATRKMLLVR